MDKNRYIQLHPLIYVYYQFKEDINTSFANTRSL